MMVVRGHSFFDQEVTDDIKNVRYVNCNFGRAMIGLSEFTSCVFEDCHFTNTFARGANISQCTFINCSFEFTYMRGATILDTVFTRCTFNNTDMPSQNRDGCVFDSCEWRHVNLGGATITNEVMRDPEMLLATGDGHVYQSMNIGYYPVTWNGEWLQIGCALDTADNWRHKWEHNKAAIYLQSDVAQSWSDKYLGIILDMIDDYTKQDK